MTSCPLIMVDSNYQDCHASAILSRLNDPNVVYTTKHEQVLSDAQLGTAKLWTAQNEPSWAIFSQCFILMMNEKQLSTGYVHRIM